MRGHLTNEELRLLAFGNMEPVEMEKALEHVGACDKCAEHLADCVLETENLLQVPPDFTKGIERKIDSFRLTATPLTAIELRKQKNASVGTGRKKNPRRELYSYAAKVGIAACLALLLLAASAVTVPRDGSGLNIVPKGDISVLYQITESMNNFSQRLINWEDRDND